MKGKAALIFAACVSLATVWAQNQKTELKASSESPDKLKQEFFAIIRNGESDKFLSYVSAGGVNVGSTPEHLRRSDVEQQLDQHTGLYCKVFDSSCLQAPINLGNSARACSYREALTHSPNARLAATDTVRNGVHQAILVAQVSNDECPGIKLIDFIFNEQSDGWKLFSVP